MEVPKIAKILMYPKLCQAIGLLASLVVKSVNPKTYIPAIGPINIIAQTVAVIEFT